MSMFEPTTLQELEDKIDQFTRENPSSFPIPKIIHQVWHAPADAADKSIPSKWIEGPRAVDKLHSDWLHIIWSETVSLEFVRKYEPDFYSTYVNYKYFIQRCDTIRYCFLKRYGGIYFDLDWVPLENIEKHIDVDAPLYFVSSSNAVGIYTNAILASKANQPFWTEVIKACKKGAAWWQISQFLTVMYTTGPKMLTECIKQYTGGFCSLSPRKFNPVSYDDIIRGQTTKEGAICRSLKGASWHTWDTSVLTVIYEYRTYFLGIIICLILVGLVWVGYYFRLGRQRSHNPFARLGFSY